MRFTRFVVAASWLLLAACGGAPQAAVKPIQSSGVFAVMEECSQVSDDYPDITAGTQVVVTNSAGTVIGTGQLQQGIDNSSESANGGCDYLFSVRVPRGLPRYGVTVSHRGTVWFSQAQMEHGPALSLGSGVAG